MVEQVDRKTVGAVIQAHVSSTRLPGKVLLPLPYDSQITVCEQIIRRLKRVESVDKVIVATSTNPQDSIIVNIADREGILTFQGDDRDVLSRFYEAAQEYNLQDIIRITSDNPCLDYKLVDSIVQTHLQEGNDYTFTQDYPVGLNVEVLSLNALKTSCENAKQPAEREHVTPYLGKHYDLFKVAVKKAPIIQQNPRMRVTLDTKEDYTLLNCIFDYLYEEDNYFGIEELIMLYYKKPWLADINYKIIQKTRFDSIEDELAKAIHMLDLQEMNKAKELLISHLK